MSNVEHRWVRILTNPPHDNVRWNDGEKIRKGQVRLAPIVHGKWGHESISCADTYANSTPDTCWLGKDLIFTSMWESLSPLELLAMEAEDD